MHFTFNKQELENYSTNIRREWALTNGIGGYAGSSVLGAHNRTHQGYLIASLHPPVSRFLVFSKTNERILQSENEFDLTSAQHKGGICTDGRKYLTRFTYDGTACFDYQAGELELHKSISLAQGKNLSAVAYEVENKGDDATLIITPLMNFREHSESSTVDTLNFTTSCLKNSFTLIPQKDPSVKIQLAFSDGTLEQRDEQYDIDMELQTEVDNEVDGLDTHFTPYDIHVQIPANSTVQFSILCRICPSEDTTDFVATSAAAFEIRQKQLEATQKLIDLAGYHDDFADVLTVAANQFLSDRASTGYKTVLAGLPWFTDWGRDTMIAFTGLTLSTRRYQEAADILLTFAQYVDHGLIPNMFPDDDLAPLYNTVDASLWYFYAVHQYLTYVNTKEAYTFIQENIYPALKQIIEAYKTGTDFSIYMDKDYLIHAGSGVDQVTWMDVRVGDWVPTPRHGKPVEINALWYNALKVMEQLATHFGEDASAYAELAKQVKHSFQEKFWNTDTNCLFDVIGDDEPDPTIRPNQIYAVSLPYTMLSKEQNQSIVDIVLDKLYVGCGLRSLDPEHADYHPIYLGALAKRDAAYHQGTAWGFLMGGFITAYVKTHGKTKETALKAMELLAPLKEHFRNGCIGSISEIFDGDAPHTCRGCYAQAWSVGEALRCYTEDILPLL